MTNGASIFNSVGARFRALFGTVAICALSVGAFAGENIGASFLKIGAGARALGMGQAFVATADDVTATYWNPAGLSRLTQRELGATHTEWIGDINHDFVAYAHPTSIGTFAGSASYLSQADIEGRGVNRQKTDNFGASDAAMALSFSRRFTRNSSYGLSLKIIDQRIGAESARGLAADMGVMSRIGANVTMALAVSNLGPGMKFLSEGYHLPLAATAGVGYRLNGHLRAEVDVRRRVYEQDTQVGTGIEYWLGGQVALRSGYLAALGEANRVSGRSTNDRGSQLDRFTGFNMGLGLRLFGQQIDYAMTPQGELGGAHRLSLSLRF